MGTKRIILLLILVLLNSCNKDKTNSNVVSTISDKIEYGNFEANKNLILSEFNLSIENDLDEILDKKFTFQISENITNKKVLIKNCGIVDITKENSKYNIFISTMWSKSLLKLKTTKKIVDKIVSNENRLPHSNFMIINLTTFSEVKLKYKLEPECYITDYELTESGDIIEDTIELNTYHPLEFERTYYGEGELLLLEF